MEKGATHKVVQLGSDATQGLAWLVKDKSAVEEDQHQAGELSRKVQQFKLFLLATGSACFARIFLSLTTEIFADINRFGEKYWEVRD